MDLEGFGLLISLDISSDVTCLIKKLFAWALPIKENGESLNAGISWTQLVPTLIKKLLNALAISLLYL